jgi:hypothetical protein
MTSSAIAASETESSAAAPGLLHVFPELRASLGAGALNGLDEAPGPEDLHRRLSDEPELTALVVYASPAAILCANADQADPQAVLDQWRIWADSVLPVLRTFRRRVRLLDAALIARAPRDAASAAGLPAELLQAIAGGRGADPDPLLLACARALVHEDPRALRASEELEASALHADPPVTAVSTSVEIFSGVHRQSAQLAAVEQACERAHEERTALIERAEGLNATIAALQAERDAARAEAGDTLERAGTLQAELEAVRTKLEAMTAERDVARAQGEAALRQRESELNARIADLTRDRDARRAERDARRSERDALREERDALAEALAAMQAERDDLGARLARVELWMHLTRSSFSYRIMQPLRKVRALFGRSDPLEPVDRSETSE